MQLPDFLSSQQAKDFIEFLKSKKPAAIVCLILIGLTFCALICFTVHSCVSRPAKIPKEAEPVAVPFSPEHPILIPSTNEMTEGYIMSRTPKPEWDSEDKEKWFTKPDTNTIEDLKKSNDDIISNVLGAAP